jgi:hypothetical protein
MKPHTIKILNAYPSTNTNGTNNIILQLDPDTTPCWLTKELETWWGITVATPDYHGGIIVGHHVLTGNNNKVIHEPILYHGTLRFDSSPCDPGVDCPTITYMILPMNAIPDPTSIQQIIIISLRRNSTPPCF